MRWRDWDIVKDFSQDLSKWETSIKAKDAGLKKQKGGAGLPPPRGSTSTPKQTKASESNLASSNSKEQTSSKAVSAADHTYDKGYKKWEKFDVDQALSEVDDDSANATKSQVKPAVMPEVTHAPVTQGINSSTPLTPGTIVAPFVANSSKTNSDAIYPDAKVQVSKPRDVMERERGNEYFAKGNMEQAVKYYTRSIGFNPRSIPAYSNRAMALLKLKDFEAADADCCAALKLDPNHVKTLLRRGTARNSLGRHRAALADFLAVRELEPSNKQAAAQCVKTREMVKSSVRRAPRRNVPIHGLPGEASEASSKENHSDANISQDQNPMAKADNCTPPSAPEHVAKPELSAEKAELNSQTKNAKSHTVGESNKLAAEKAANLQDKSWLVQQTPKTAYEFERVWKELKGQHDLQSVLLLDRLGASGVGKLFANGAPESDMFLEIVGSFKSAFNTSNAEGIAQVMEAFSRINGMKMTLMFLSETDKHSIKSLIDNLESENQPVDSLRKVFT